ncbi:hypothetical protein C8Q75DRAFT_753008 [Abortiporus biennis]|nr:hypothetical protein C8Q75DRAFT_753008 [Abortiporus biennis]
MPVLQRSSTHLDSFFNQYAQYTYNPNASVAREFQRLGQRMGWSDDERRIARERYREALTNEFNDIFGTDPSDYEAWKKLFGILKISPVPASVLECTRVIKSVNVNLVDVVNAARNPTVVPTPRKFGTVKELRKYSYKNKKIFPRDKAKSGGVLKFMLRMISAA